MRAGANTLLGICMCLSSSFRLSCRSGQCSEQLGATGALAARERRHHNTSGLLWAVSLFFGEGSLRAAIRSLAWVGEAEWCRCTAEQRDAQCTPWVGGKFRDAAPGTLHYTSVEIAAAVFCAFQNVRITREASGEAMWAGAASGIGGERKLHPSVSRARQYGPEECFEGCHARRVRHDGRDRSRRGASAQSFVALRGHPLSLPRPLTTWDGGLDSTGRSTCPATLPNLGAPAFVVLVTDPAEATGCVAATPDAPLGGALAAGGVAYAGAPAQVRPQVPANRLLMSDRQIRITAGFHALHVLDRFLSKVADAISRWVVACNVAAAGRGAGPMPPTQPCTVTIRGQVRAVWPHAGQLPASMLEPAAPSPAFGTVQPASADAAFDRVFSAIYGGWMVRCMTLERVSARSQRHAAGGLGVESGAPLTAAAQPLGACEGGPWASTRSTPMRCRRSTFGPWLGRRT